MARAYEEILNELKSFVIQRWPGWNTEAKHIGNILLECLADQIEKQEYRLDAIQNELFPDTATQYESLLRWARLLGYEVQSARPAETVLTFSLPSPAEANIVIPLGTKVTTVGPAPIPFMTVTGAVIYAGQTSVSVSARQAEQKEDSFTGAGEASQIYQTSYGPVWMESLRVHVDGAEWVKVQNFLLSDSTDPHYVAEIQDDGTVLVMFGDGVNGKAPPQGSEIDIAYMITLGSEGNVPAGSITSLESVLYDANGYIADVKVSNNEAATGGENQEDINHLRESIPAWIATSSRCVTKNDFEQTARAVSGVARVLAMTKDEDETIPALTVKIYVVPDGGGSPLQALLDAVLNAVTVDRPNVLTVAVDVQPAKYVTVNVTCTVTVAQGYEVSIVQAAVEDAIAEFFSYSRLDTDGTWAMDFGKPVYLSKLTAWVINVAGVANVSFASPTGDVIPNTDEIPALGEVVVSAS